MVSLAWWNLLKTSGFSSLTLLPACLHFITVCYQTKSPTMRQEPGRPLHTTLLQAVAAAGLTAVPCGRPVATPSPACAAPAPLPVALWRRARASCLRRPPGGAGGPQRHSWAKVQRRTRLSAACPWTAAHNAQRAAPTELTSMSEPMVIATARKLGAPLCPSVLDSWSCGARAAATC